MKTLIVTGVASLVVAVVLMGSGNPLWWAFLTLGGALFFSGLNSLRGPSSLLQRANKNADESLQIYGLFWRES